jgi:exopolyphosphatase/guanosine-5'-triphosphate,3'-diphosphate pyrophosphatase
MRVAVIDVGSNTVRLLVAAVRGADRIEPIADEKAFLWLGAELAQRGELGPKKQAELSDTARAFARIAHDHDIARLETIVTAPGRGRGAESLLETLGQATGAPVRVLSASEEGRLAWEGAVARAGDLPDVVGVADVGGGSTELVVGTPLAGPAWVCSLAIGSLRLTERFFRGDPPSPDEVARARASAQEELVTIDPPIPDRVFATGGSARTAAKILGRRYDASALDEAILTLTGRSAAETAAAHGLHAERARTIAAGAIILAEIARLLDRPLERARGGLREGAALSLAADTLLAA